MNAASIEAARLERVDDWETFRALIEAAGEPETVMTGDPERRKHYYAIDLIRMDDGWHYRRDYSFPNGGGGGPFGRDAYATRDDALVHGLRELLKGIARDVATSASSGYPEAWAQWAIGLSPPPLFGGPDLGAEYDAMVAKYRSRNALRCAAIRAADHVPGSTYVDEEGRERSVYSL